MKLISPWRYSTTSLERCLATSEKPIFSNSGSSVLGTGEANSTNSKPHKPMGLSNKSDMKISREKQDRLSPRAAGKVNTENQNLDGHGAMVTAKHLNVKRCFCVGSGLNKPRCSST
eukprot:gene49918-66865_t